MLYGTMSITICMYFLALFKLLVVTMYRYGQIQVAQGNKPQEISKTICIFITFIRSYKVKSPFWIELYTFAWEISTTLHLQQLRIQNQWLILIQLNHISNLHHCIPIGKLSISHNVMHSWRYSLNTLTL